MLTIQEAKVDHERGKRMGCMISGIRRQLMKDERVRGREEKMEAVVARRIKVGRQRVDIVCEHRTKVQDQR